MTPPEAPATLVAPPTWQRLDPRMMLVHPVRDALRLWPLLLGLLVAGSRGDGSLLQLGVVAVPVVVGLVRYLTTTYRLADGRVDLRRGLLGRRTTSTRVDRVRTVDLTASPVHRLLGLTTVRIGTGTASSDDDAHFDLDGLPPAQARALRDLLLRSSTMVGGSGGDGAGAATEGAGRPAGPAPEPTHVAAAFSASWLRYAPFTGRGFVLAAAGLGALFQVASTLELGRRLRGRSLPVDGVAAVVSGVVVAAVILTLLSVVGYLVADFGFRLTRVTGARRSWHVSRGLLTTRETTVDDDRLAGVVLGEPLLLRLAGARHLTAVVTGLDRKERGSATLVPPAPAAVVRRAAAAVVGSAGPVDAPLLPHGPAAARRRVTRVVLSGLVPLALLGALAAAVSPWWWTAVAVLVAAMVVVARDRVAGLGHAHVDGHLVARSGALARRREMLGDLHVIGWTIRSTWFQRRKGLVTLTATTAGGRQRVDVLDVPLATALGLAESVTPGLIAPFAASPRRAP